jgi:PAS domain-containing protein
MTNIINKNFDAFVLLDTLPVGVVLYGADTRILYANKKALAVLHMTAEQVLGKEALDLHWRVVDIFQQPLSHE